MSQQARKVITTVVRHVVSPGQETEFQQWAKEIDLACRNFDGYLGKELIRSHDNAELVFFSIFRFDNTENLESWMYSEERRAHLEDPRSFYTKTSRVKSYEGVAFWLQPPGITSPVPSNAKLSLVTFLAIWPMVHWIAPVMSSITTSTWIAEMTTVGVIVLLMSYAVMPLVDRFLSKWLYR